MWSVGKTCPGGFKFPRSTMREILSRSIGETVKTDSDLPAGSLDSGGRAQALRNTDVVRIVPARIGTLSCVMGPFPQAIK